MLGGGEGAVKVLRATLLVLLPSVCVAQCKTATATLKVKIGASEVNKALLVKKLNQHGCNHGLQFELVDDGFDYRIFLLDVAKPRMTLTQAGIGSAYESVVLTTVFDDKGTKLFESERGNRLTHAGAVNASAKEIVKRLMIPRASAQHSTSRAKEALCVRR